MRTINKIININKYVQAQETAVIENMASIYEDKNNKSIRVLIEYLDNTNNVISSDYYTLENDNYNLIMSENPSFAPNKQQNEYREIDLWYMIDLIRNGQNVTTNTIK